MHSSGMRTAHLLTVSEHAVWLVGCTCPGDVPYRGVYLLRGVCTCPGEGVPAQ